MTSLLAMPTDLAGWLLVAGGVTAAAFLALVLFVIVELRKPTPKTGTRFTLPNGMEIQQWQKSETDFLYDEIWGKESAYSKEDKIVFTPGATIVDAGANIGMFSLYAAARCRGDASIYSFEPIPTTFAVLQANSASAIAGAYASVFKPATGAKLTLKPFNVGLSDAPASVVFEHHPNFSVWSTQDAKFAETRIGRIAGDLPRATAGSSNFFTRMLPSALVAWLGGLFLSKLGQTVKVPATLVRLSSVIASESMNTIDVLKVDVEGAEMAVLRGIDAAHWPKIQQVVLEVESFALRDEVIALLRPRGFTCEWVASERERSPGVLSEVCMVYASRPEYMRRAAAGRQ